VKPSEKNSECLTRKRLIDPKLKAAGWLIPVAILGFAVVLWFARQPLQRIIIATGTWRAGIFTPPPPAPGESHWSQTREEARFYWDLSGLRVAWAQRLKQVNPTLKPLVKEIARRQNAGQDMQYSMHIYTEIRWRLNFTPDLETTRLRIADLRQSLDQPEQQKIAGQQQPTDGSWGLGFDVWYLRLYSSVDHVKGTAGKLKYPLVFLDRINSPEKLTAQLNADLYDNFTQTRVFNREELDETFSALARLLFSSQPVAYSFHPQLRDALRQFVERWQNPVTGCWGQWMVDRQGRVWKMDDMGITFHVVSDLHGQVGQLDRIAKRLLQLDRVNFPAGIRFNGHYENHLNWDAVKIFRTAWPYFDDATKHQARNEISGMLHWCLTQSLQPDGSFKVSDLDETPSDAYRYGIWFLEETGYFRPTDRFWTNRNFPEAIAVRARIMGKLSSIGLSDPGLREAYETLRAAP
jgi:hypothetical protein